MSDLVMDLRLVWNSKRLKEIDEAKAEYRKYRSQGYEIQKPDGTAGPKNGQTYRF